MFLFLLVYVCSQILCVGPHAIPDAPRHGVLVDALHVQPHHSRDLLAKQISHEPNMSGILPPDDYFQQIDPVAPLSNEDLVRLLMHRCENVKYERELTNDKVKMILIHLNERFDAVNNEIRNRETVHAKEAAELDLKIDTISTYHELLLSNLKTGIKDALLLIEKDMNTVWNKTKSCDSCARNCAELDTLRHHMQNLREEISSSLLPGYCCNLCGLSFQSDDMLSLHIRCHHMLETPGFSCILCGYIFQDVKLLDVHLNEYHPDHHTHREPDSLTAMYRGSSGATLTCNLCKNLFKTKVTLQDHIRDQHGVDASFMCSNCDNLFSSKTDLEQHMSAYHSTAEPFQCYKCDVSFESHEDLKIHTNASHHTELSLPKAVLMQPELHCVPPSELINQQHMKHTCYKCDKAYQTHHDLVNHVRECHQKHFPFPCDHCSESFTDVKDLNAHIDTVHLDDFTYSTGLVSSLSRIDHLCPTSTCENLEICPHKCPICAKTFDLSAALREHMITCHEGLSLQPDVNEEHIPQYDGPDQDLYEFSNVPSFNTIRKAAYSFNQQKQTDKIKEDAALNDFNVNVNNSDQNATVKCSSGFYIQVARASLGTLNNRSVLSCCDIAMTVDQVTVTEDKTGLEGTKLLSLSFMSDQKLLGGVKVHLHHSTRTIQIQGGSIMPDNSRAALWFLNNFVLIQFKDLAKAKNFSIRNTNAAILSAPSSRSSDSKISATSSNSCQSCNSLFDTRSKPSKCINCGKFLHKTGCLKEHMKLCSKQRVISVAASAAHTSSGTTTGNVQSSDTSRTTQPSSMA